MPNLKRQISSILKMTLPCLTNKDIELFIKIGSYQKFENKKNILKSGTKSKKAFLIITGAVRGFVMNDEGFEKNIVIRSQGIFTADARHLFNDEDSKMTFQAMGQTEIMLFNYADFEKLALENTNIMLLHLQILKDAVSILTYRIETLTTMNSEERYLDLVKLNPAFLKKTYAKYLANYLGITPVSLSRIMNKVKTES